MTANAGYHAYATGDVLTAAQVQYNLQNQTTMYFATSSARTTALSGVLVEGMVSYIPANGIEYYNGSAWVSISQAVTALTTKGDLLTYSTQDTRLPVGSDGQTLVANSAQTTGLAYTNNFAAGKNAVINGAFNVWQRGTSISYTGSAAVAFGADRFYHSSNGNGAWTFSQQALTPGSITGYDSPYFYRASLPTVGTTTTLNWGQKIENVQTMANQSVTISFWAKADSTRSLSWTIEQNFGSGGSTTVSTGGASFNATTSWARYTSTITVPSISGKTIGTSSYLGVYINAGSLTSGFILDIWGVQVESGSVVTAFQTATGTLQGELAACQRYYYRWVSGRSGGGGTGLSMGLGAHYNATQLNLTCVFPVTMRTNPTLVATSGTSYYKFERNAATDYFDSLTIYNSGISQTMLYNASEISGTAGQAGSVSTDTDASSVAFSAEL